MSPVSELPGPPERATRETRESAYDKLDLDGKLTIEQPATETHTPEEPPPIPEPAPAPKPGRKPEVRIRAGATVLPETVREAPAQEEASAPEVSPLAPVVLPKPTDTTLRLMVPRLGLSDVTVGDSPEQSYLDRADLVVKSGMYSGT